MNVTNNIFNYAPNISFQKNKINPDVKNTVRNFKTMCRFAETDRNEFGRICHFIQIPISAGLVLSYLSSDSFLGAALWGGNILLSFGLDKLFHNIAMRKSQLLVKKLKNEGKDNKFINESVNYYLKKNGGIIYSNFVRKFKSKDIKKVVNGENAPQLKGLIPFVQTKLAIFSSNKPLKIKCRRNLKKYLRIK